MSLHDALPWDPHFPDLSRGVTDGNPSQFDIDMPLIEDFQVAADEAGQGSVPDLDLSEAEEEDWEDESIDHVLGYLVDQTGYANDDEFEEGIDGNEDNVDIADTDSAFSDNHQHRPQLPRKLRVYLAVTKFVRDHHFSLKAVMDLRKLVSDLCGVCISLPY